MRRSNRNARHCDNVGISIRIHALENSNIVYSEQKVLFFREVLHDFAISTKEARAREEAHKMAVRVSHRER